MRQGVLSESTNVRFDVMAMREINVELSGQPIRASVHG
jgi:hypothetical protein